jgi:hypothetical protein
MVQLELRASSTSTIYQLGFKGVFASRNRIGYVTKDNHSTPV